MKIHYLTLTLDEGYGGVKVLFNIMNLLASKGHEVTLTTVLPQRHLPFALERHIVFNQIELAELNFLVMGICRILRTLFRYDIDSYGAIRKFVSNKIPECDINVAYSCGDVFPVYESGKGIPFHHMQHDEVLISSDLYVKAVADEAYHLPIRRIVNSIWLKNRMKEKYGLELPIVYPAIDHEIFFPHEVSRRSDKKIVLCFGKQQTWKGLIDAFQAMKIVRKEVANIEFQLYGRKPVQVNVSDVPYTFYRNPSDEELAKLYSSADVFISPSWYESFPLSPLEAMACGCPVVTTRYGTEDYAFHEVNSLVVPPRNPKMMAEAIIRLLKDESLIEQFRKEGPKTAREFTWDKTARKVEEIFMRAVKEDEAWHRKRISKST
jgi:glycosyltransferase involved in cell wall biosynthesis